MLSSEICEIFKNTFSYRTPPVAASEIHSSFSFLVQKPFTLEENGVSFFRSLHITYQQIEPRLVTAPTFVTQSVETKSLDY